MNIVFSPIFGQHSYILTGTVTDETNQALPGASVILLPLKEIRITDRNGKFFINNLPQGTYIIQISFIGYKSVIDTIVLRSDKTYNALARHRSQNLKEVVVTDKHAEKQKKEATLNSEIVKEEYLKQNMGSGIMNSLERLPGVSTIDIGSGQSKPVIRGLGFNRVLVVENNIKHESQQWGADHGLEIDQYAIDNVTVIKGPASLMYGSDAISGVIDMKTKPLPFYNMLGGTLDVTGKSNNDFLGTSLVLFGRKDNVFANVRATVLNYGDYRVPTDSIDIYSYRAALHKRQLRNTAGNETNLHITLGYIQKRFENCSYISNVNTTNGFFANAHGLEPRRVDIDLHDKSGRDINYPKQNVNHFKVIHSFKYTWENVQLKSDFGFQKNVRKEWSAYVSHGYMPAVFPDTLPFDADLERQFEKFVYTGNINLEINVFEKTNLSVGVNSEIQNNRINGRSFIIPAYHQTQTGCYIVTKHTINENNTILSGIRYDYGNINTASYYDWFPSPVFQNDETKMVYLQRARAIKRSFSNITWSVGYAYNPKEWMYKANIGKSFRMPIAKELAANGVNYHHFSYEVGNEKISEEMSYQMDASIEYSSNPISISTTPFLNYFPNYIYLYPSSNHDRLYGNGNQIFYYKQCQVFRYGAEINAQYQILKMLQLGIIGEYVYSEQLTGDKKGFTLPFSPPASLIFNVKYQKTNKKYIENSYISFDYRITATQNNIVPPEEVTYSSRVININLGGDVKISKQKVNLRFQIQNLLNTKYFNHTGYYRLINVPEPGRNIVVNISIPFIIKKLNN
ncbi:MAG: TonB-dependent receptor [Bacteroidales bacterium]